VSSDPVDINTPCILPEIASGSTLDAACKLMCASEPACVAFKTLTSDGTCCMKQAYSLSAITSQVGAKFYAMQQCDACAAGFYRASPSAGCQGEVLGSSSSSSYYYSTSKFLFFNYYYPSSCALANILFAHPFFVSHHRACILHLPALVIPPVLLPFATSLTLPQSLPAGFTVSYPLFLLSFGARSLRNVTHYVSSSHSLCSPLSYLQILNVSAISPDGAYPLTYDIGDARMFGLAVDSKGIISVGSSLAASGRFSFSLTGKRLIDCCSAMLIIMNYLSLRSTRTHPLSSSFLLPSSSPYFSLLSTLPFRLTSDRQPHLVHRARQWHSRLDPWWLQGFSSGKDCFAYSGTF
jgi:hypothetical protein